MSKCVWLVEEQPNPSTDYYLLPAFSSLGWEAARFHSSDALPGNVPEGQVIVFVRYVPDKWIKLIDCFRSRVSQLIFFMDDDLLDVYASKGTPWRYRLKLALRSASRKSWLMHHKARIWVSTPYLYEKYAAQDAKLVPPSPIASQQARTFFYHGSAAHDAEIRWLRPVVETVLKRDEGANFEIIGGKDVVRLYRGLSRVTVVHPMKWPAFQKFHTSSGRAVGLAPVLDTHFNKARSYTKFFDITRSGAAGIYTRESAFGSAISHGVDGFLQKNDQEEWAGTILALLNDAALRKRLIRNAERKMEELGSAAQKFYGCLC